MHMQIDYALVMEAIMNRQTSGFGRYCHAVRTNPSVAILHQHGIAMRVTGTGAIEACNVLVDAHGTVRHEWTDITSMTLGELYRWLGY
jgi:hypothetical protein